MSNDKTTTPDDAAVAEQRDKFARLAVAIPKLAPDRLNQHQPHTPRPGQLPDRNNPTCSQPHARNKGCESFGHCRLQQLKEQNAGPVQVVIENHTDLTPGEGRRHAMWCFIAYRQILGQHKRAEHSICPDRVYERQVRGEFIVEQLPPYEEQGPFYARAEASAPVADVAAMRQKFLDQKEAGDDSPVTGAAPPPPDEGRVLNPGE